jgi:hypothetical protein
VCDRVLSCCNMIAWTFKNGTTSGTTIASQ